MQPEVSEQNMEDYQGEIPVAVLDELMAMKMALQLSGSELADRCRQRFGLSVDWRTLLEAIGQRRIARAKMNGDTELWDALQRRGGLLDLFACVLHCLLAEWTMLRDAKAWAARNGCLDDFPSGRLQRMEVLSDQIKGFFLEVHARLDPETIKFVFDQFGVSPKNSIVERLVKGSAQRLLGTTSKM